MDLGIGIGMDVGLMEGLMEGVVGTGWCGAVGLMWHGFGVGKGV